jgi:hypothetical protein
MIPGTIEYDLTEMVKNIQVRLTATLEIENPNTEIKREWYDLEKGKPDYKFNLSAFISEITAIVNNRGPWDGFMIIGLDKNGVAFNAPLTNCGLKDESQLYNLIVSAVENPYPIALFTVTLEEAGVRKHISVIKIPRSIKKPHVMDAYVTAKYTYKSYIPVKIGGSVRQAKATDIQAMVFDNQQSIPEYALDIKQVFQFDTHPGAGFVSLTFPVVLENYGRKPIIITHGIFTILQSRILDIKTNIDFNLGAYNYADHHLVGNIEINTKPIIVASNEAKAYKFFFVYWGNYEGDLKKDYDFQVTLIDIHGNEFRSEVYPKTVKPS